MNYESRQIGGEDRAALPDYTPAGPAGGVGRYGSSCGSCWSRSSWFGHCSCAVMGKPVVAPVEQVPSVSVVVPGRQTIDRQLSANGSLAAKREMPVGVAGEGGMVRQVLVEPGQWVQAGQVLATIDRSVQTQTAASLGASIKVAQADATLAQSELDRAQQLVWRAASSPNPTSRPRPRPATPPPRASEGRAGATGAAAGDQRAARHPRARRRAGTDATGRTRPDRQFGVGHAVPRWRWTDCWKCARR